MSMRFYQATRFLFPRNYQLRVFAICFCAVHLPLIAFCVVQPLVHAWHWGVFAAILLATLAGTGGAIAALSALLSPITHATRMLRHIQSGIPIEDVPDGGDDLVGELLSGVARAAEETAARIDRLSDAAETDILTGLRNRRGFLDAIAPMLRADRPSVMAMIDLDHFKAINDRSGHDEGDRVLRAFARRLQDSVRRCDIAARWGGEEFAVLLPGIGIDAARDIVERLRQSLHQRGIGRQSGEPVTFSCGLAVATDYAALGTAIRDADAALYEAKRAGRDRVAELI